MDGGNDTNMRYPRDMLGYGAVPPRADWPGGAAIAVQFVVNYEEGGENCILHKRAQPNTRAVDRAAHLSKFALD